ncbi:ionotropic receptor 21a-like [Panulirus ornatus]|uniref:ionotropic receptor 21a-like n=1 Tax=Panulirus ornatus TaxID=150431 RepID=UPI003A8B5093
MLGDVYRGEKQLAINYFTVTSERALDFDFSVSYFNEGFGLSLLVPPPLPRWSSVVRPFTGPVWAAMGGLLLLGAVVLYAIAKRRLPALDAFFLVLMGVTNEPVWHVPREWSQRLFLASWWVGGFVLVVCYTGNLIAVLTVPTFPSRLCMHDYGEFVPEALATSTERALAALGDKLDLVPIINEMTFKGIEGCIEMVLSGTHALIETLSYMEVVYIKLGHGSRVYPMKDQIYKGSLAFIFQKGTPWKVKFDDGIQRMVEAGLVHKWHSDLMDELKRGTEEDTSSGRLQSLTLAHLQGPLYLLLTGLAISTVCFVGEHLAYFSPSRTCFWRTSKPWKTDLERT